MIRGQAEREVFLLSSPIGRQAGHKMFVILRRALDFRRLGFDWTSQTRPSMGHLSKTNHNPYLKDSKAMTDRITHH
jgi:hypothetical protein